MLTKEERLNIEKIGVPYATAIICREWNIPIGSLELVTDIERQYKGIDYNIQTNDGYSINIDTKHQADINYKQKRTGYGVDWLSMEVRKKNGRRGWAIDYNLLTDYLIYMINGVGYYMIDSKALRHFMNEYWYYYPLAYKPVEQYDYRAVPVQDLFKYGAILYYKDWHEVSTSRVINPMDIQLYEKSSAPV